MNSNYKHLLAGLSPKEKRALLKQLLLRKGPGGQLRKLVSDVEVRNVSNLQDEAILDPEISPDAKSARTVRKPTNVFLTGATGFLGSFLLAELLQRTGAKVHCLVRASNAEEGEERIKRALAYYSLWNEGFTPRIVPIAGDLSEPLFGLSEEGFRTLAGGIDTIYHSGASVNWVFPYEALKPINVLGTQEVLRLASQSTTKPVHFVSTLGVFPLVGNTEAEVFGEADPLDHGGGLYNGYTQSKWVAEKLVTIGRSRGLPVNIYRPALVTGSSQTGAWNTDDITCKMIRTLVELGTVPDDVDRPLSMVPVDYLSKAIVHLSGQNESLGKCFHFANPRPVGLSDVAGWLRSYGYPLRGVPYDRWRAELIDPANWSQDNGSGEKDLYSLAPLFSLSNAKDAPTLFKEMPEFDCKNTLEGLAGSSIVCPSVDDRVFETYLSFFVRHGFLKQPMAA